MSSKQELWFVAEGQTVDGKNASISVYRQGSLIYLSGGGSFSGHHCHACVKSEADVEAEILSVYGISITKKETRQESAAKLNAHLKQYNETHESE